MKRKLIIAIHVVLLAITAGYFWTQSRYPALDTKEYFGDRNRMTGISYDKLVGVSPQDPWMSRVYGSTVNWYFTNWKGMTFGLIFAALMLSLFNFIRVKQFKNRWLSAASGMVFGAPLGVCVNCATPIGQGLDRVGLRSEFVLSSTLSSPTLNFIIISMLLTSFPMHLIFLKLASTLVLILVILPLLAPKQEAIVTPAPDAAEFCIPTGDPKTYWIATKQLFESLSRSAMRILILSIPLMALSGILGAIVIESIDLEHFGASSIAGLVGISIIGTILPVPMSFDVVFAHKLLETAMPTAYVAALLVTLGAFSVYPFLVFGRTYSWKFAMKLAGVVAVLGATAGFAAEKYELHLAEANSSDFERTLASARPAAQGGYFRDVIEQHCKGPHKDDCIVKAVMVAALTAPMEDVCDGISAKPKADECVFISRLQRGTLAPSDCYKTGQELGCLAAFAEIVSPMASDAVADRSCAENTTSQTCKDVISLRKGAHSGNLHMCKEIVNMVMREKCVNVAAVTTADNFGTPRAEAACQNLNNDQSYYKCLSEVYVSESDDAKCGELHFEKSSCHVKVALSKAPPNPTEESVCAAVAEEERAECIDVAHAEVARFLIRQAAQIKMMSKVSLAIKKNGAEIKGEKLGDEPVVQAATYPIERRKDFISGDVSVSSFAFRAKSPRGEKEFERIFMTDLGIKRSSPQTWEAMSFSRGFGVASGDVNGDGWPDLAIGEPDGVSVYVNEEGKSFKKLTLPKIEGALAPVNVALVDLNNDGLDDLYVANFDGHIFVIENDGHGFANGKIHPLPDSGRGWAVGAAFGDFNKDGYLDVFIGNTGAFAPNEKMYLTDQYKNEIFLGGPNFTFKKVEWEDARGATLSVLASDVNGDGNLDLLEGNDFSATDYLYLGDGKGGFRKVLKGDGLVPTFAYGSMGFDTADFDNDLKMDIFSAGNGRQAEQEVNYCQIMAKDGLDPSECRQITKISKAIIRQMPSVCDTLQAPHNKMECYVGILSTLARRMRLSEACDKIPDEFYFYKHSCSAWFEVEHERRQELAEDIPQKFIGNVLLRGLGSGKFEEIAKPRGIENTHWAWTSKFADLDNDGWQDIYSVNGRMHMNGMSPKMFFKNERGNFLRRDQEVGLDDLYDVTSFVFMDYDLDGDIDVVSNGVLVPHRLYRNAPPDNQSVSFSFDDSKGNRAGIGNMLTIRYHDALGKEKAQMREVKVGGGYASYDPKMLHFGLGDAKSIDSVEVRWSTGQITKLGRKLEAGRHYLISRK